MKWFLFISVMAAATTPALAADVAMSVSVSQPGFYGRIDIGNFPQPQLIYAKPVVIQPVLVDLGCEPIYMHVPPGHAKNWRKYCHKYNACGQPVYFVKEKWYNNVYVPRYREHHSGGYDKGYGKGYKKSHGKGHKKD